MSRPVDPLTVALIRTLNGRAPGVAEWSDAELVGAFGAAAQPLVDGLREAIRAEVAEALFEHERGSWHAGGDPL